MFCRKPTKRPKVEKQVKQPQIRREVMVKIVMRRRSCLNVVRRSKRRELLTVTLKIGTRDESVQIPANLKRKTEYLSFKRPEYLQQFTQIFKSSYMKLPTSASQGIELELQKTPLSLDSDVDRGIPKRMKLVDDIGFSMDGLGYEIDYSTGHMFNIEYNTESVIPDNLNDLSVKDIRDLDNFLLQNSSTDSFKLRLKKISSSELNIKVPLKKERNSEEAPEDLSIFVEESFLIVSPQSKEDNNKTDGSSGKGDNANSTKSNNRKTKTKNSKHSRFKTIDFSKLQSYIKNSDIDLKLETNSLEKGNILNTEVSTSKPNSTTKSSSSNHKRMTTDDSPDRSIIVVKKHSKKRDSLSNMGSAMQYCHKTANIVGSTKILKSKSASDEFACEGDGSQRAQARRAEELRSRQGKEYKEWDIATKREKTERFMIMNDFESYDDLIVKESNIHGKGLFTPILIKRNTLIMNYIGEVIGKCVSDRREKMYKINNIDSVYMFAISDDMIIDATMVGNKARYINHSCNPNCETINSAADNSIIYRSIRDIYPEEELTINYFMSQDMDGEKCRCGEVTCKSRRI